MSNRRYKIDIGDYYLINNSKNITLDFDNNSDNDFSKDEEILVYFKPLYQEEYYYLLLNGVKGSNSDNPFYNKTSQGIHQIIIPLTNQGKNFNNNSLYFKDISFNYKLENKINLGNQSNEINVSVFRRINSEDELIYLCDFRVILQDNSIN